MEDLKSLIESWSSGDFKVTFKENLLTIDTSDGVFSIFIIANDSGMTIKPGTDRGSDQHLSKLINGRGFKSIDEIPDLMDFIRDTIPEIKSWCIGCLRRLEFQTEDYITCGKIDCDYKFEEMKFGDPVLEEFKKDKELVRFLLISAIDASTCNRKLDIFEPFPNHFLKDSIKKDELSKVRGEVTKLVGKNYDAYKDFEKVSRTVKKIDIEKVFDIFDMSRNDQDIIDTVGEDVYTFIRFTIMSCKTGIIRDKLSDSTHSKVYRIEHQPDKEDEFKKIKDKEQWSHYLFHGSNWHNWYSILRNGLKNCSKTKLMTAGAAYGDGIYLSSDLRLSYRYGVSGQKSVIGVFEVAGPREKFNKGNSVYVVPDSKYLIQRYLILIPSRSSEMAISEYNDIFNKQIYKEEKKTQTTVLSKGIKKLIREYKKIAKQDPAELGFKVTVDPNSAYDWKVFINKYDEKYPIGRDMKELGIKEIELEVKFPDNYPFGPPFIRIITPRFKYLTGHVTQAGALCMEVLTPKGWSPVCSIESLIVTIKSEIIEGEGRIDRANWNRPYSLEEAKSSFVRVARSHRWL